MKITELFIKCKEIVIGNWERLDTSWPFPGSRGKIVSREELKGSRDHLQRCSAD
jgi:hypothetical protein